ncbi:hypothetical protein HN51_012198 [Arachis hypogaea]
MMGRKAVRLKSTRNKRAKPSKLEDKDHADNSKDKDHADDSENSVTISSNEDAKQILKDMSSTEQSDLFAIVTFKRENFVQSRHPPGKQYDTIHW